MGAYTGYLARKVGVNLVFAPVVDVNNNPHNPVIGDRSFGEDPILVSKKGIAFMQGMQAAGVLAVLSIYRVMAIQMSIPIWHYHAYRMI